MWNKILAYGQSIILFFLGILLLLWTNTSSLFGKLELRQIIGVSISICGGLAFYFESTLEKILLKGSSSMEITNLNDAILKAAQYAGHLHHFRIYAVSSFVIQPIFRASNLRAKCCSLLLYSVPNKKYPQSSLEAIHEQSVETIIGEWKQLKKMGFIDNLNIKRYNFFPTQYFLIFDEKALIVGEYLLSDNKIGFCDVLEPYVITDDTINGKLLIRKHIDKFESIISSVRSEPV